MLGIFVALLSNALIANSAGGSSETFWFGVAAWRWMFLIEAVPAAAYGIMALFLPESPRYLIRKNQLDRASKVVYDYTGEPDDDLKIERDPHHPRAGGLREPAGPAG